MKSDKNRSSRPFTFVVLGLAVLGGCAVYDGSLIKQADDQGAAAGDAAAGSPSSADQSGSGGVSVAGSVNASAGSAGLAAAAGGDELPGASAGAGGEDDSAGGAQGGSPHGGTSGLGGVGGKPTAAGSAGTLGGTSGTSGAAGAGLGGSAGAGTVGSAGTGGVVIAPLCSDHPISAKATWIPSASHTASSPAAPVSKVIDDTIARWATGKAQSGDEWLQIDFGATVNIRNINLQQGNYPNDYPRSYAVVLSDTDKNLTGTVRATGLGTSGVTTTIVMSRFYSGRYLLVKQLGSSLSWWSVVEIEVSCSDN